MKWIFSIDYAEIRHLKWQLGRRKIVGIFNFDKKNE